MSKNQFITTSFISKKAKISIYKAIKEYRQRSAIMSFAFLFMCAFSFLSYINRFSSEISNTCITAEFAFIVILAFSLIISLKSYFSLWLDLNRNSKNKVSGRIVFLKDIDTRYTIYRYKLKLDNKQYYWVDKRMFRALKKGQNIHLSYYDRSKIVRSIKLISP